MYVYQKKNESSSKERKSMYKEQTRARPRM